MSNQNFEPIRTAMLYYVSLCFAGDTKMISHEKNDFPHFRWRVPY